MADEIRTVQLFRVKYNDIFHLKNLYVMLHEYLNDEGWHGEDGYNRGPWNTHRDIEKLYMERHHQKSLHKGGMELWLWWRLRKWPYTHKYHGYYEFRLEIDFHGMYLQKIEIMHQGKKLNVDKGELELWITPKIIRTGGKAWKNHWLLKWFWELYEKRIISQDLDKMEKELWREAYRMQGVIKAYLNMRNFIPVPEPFHPKLYGMEANP